MPLGMLEGALLSAFLQVLFERLARRRVLESFLGRNFDQTLFEKLKTALQTVCAVLTDAEREQIINLAVQLWVNDLKDAIYQAEDLLDEIATIAKIFRQVSFRFVKIRNNTYPLMYNLKIVITVLFYL